MRLRFVTLTGALVVGALTLNSLAVGSVGPGCGPVLEAISESPTFTPYELRRSTIPDPILNPLTAAPPTALNVPASLRAETLQWSDTSATDATFTSYYLESPVIAMPLSTFFASGGLQLAQEPVRDGVVFAQTLQDEIGERATSVQVGQFEGVVIWADPDIRGNRTHNLYWSDGVTNFSLLGVMTPEELVTLGRSLACS